MNRKEAANSLLVICSLTIIFNLLVLIGVVPQNMVWGGKLKSKIQLYVLELVALALNAFLMYIVLQKARYISRKLDRKWLNNFLFCFVVIFLLNTIGNLFAESSFEKVFGTILTGVSAICCWVLAKSKMY